MRSETDGQMVATIGQLLPTDLARWPPLPRQSCCDHSQDETSEQNIIRSNRVHRAEEKTELPAGGGVAPCTRGEYQSE